MFVPAATEHLILPQLCALRWNYTTAYIGHADIALHSPATSVPKQHCRCKCMAIPLLWVGEAQQDNQV